MRIQTTTKRQAGRHFRGRAWWLVLPVLLVMGCDTVSYYRQAAVGQYQILARQRPIPEVLARSDTPAALRRELEMVLELRRFAERELKLKTDGHYFKYADLGRKHVVWNVYAAQEFSLEPRKWWYPVVGSLKYRGFFSESKARAYGAQLTKQGLDVYVGGVNAYSTLGWFKDPVLNTFVHSAPADLAETLFHELAHQRVFASGDTDFNEAFATCVGEEGARRWLQTHADAKTRDDYELDLERQAQFVALILKTREELKGLYGDEAPKEPPLGGPDSRRTFAILQRAQKERVLDRLRADYEVLKASWGGYGGYDNWFNRPLNNAHFNTVATYQHFVPGFKRLLAQNDGDLEKFYFAAKGMAGVDKVLRHQQLAGLIAGTNQIAGTSSKPIGPSIEAGRVRPQALPQ